MPLPESARLTRWERIGLAFAALFVLAFAGLTELRSCFLSSRMTDFGVYLRAGWAVRSGADLYQVTDNNHWHYVYPPAFAVLMAPLADAPDGEPRDGLVPYPISVALWTFFNFFLVGRIAHVLAALIVPNEVHGSRRWWYARTVPIYIALGGLGFTIAHGQVNILLVALLVEMFRAGTQGKRLQSGLWLAGAITLKVFPAYLLFYPLLRRDGRSLGGVALGLVLGLAVIPVCGLGFERTEAAYRSFVGNVLLPGTTGDEKPKLAYELIDVRATDSQSFQSAIHHNLYPDRLTQPNAPSPETKLAHVAIAATLTLLTLLAAWRNGLSSTTEQLIVLGLLTLLMLHSTPVSHMHYYALGYPLAAGLWLKGMLDRRDALFPGWRVAGPLVLWAVGTALPLFPGLTFDYLRYHGLGLVSSLTLWAITFVQLCRKPTAAAPPVEMPVLRKAA
jgi:hypothetical protein